ncbi:hypothetical protein HHI36_012205 [Cryptolaemus montrouzieri]|uniref:Serpin domain-containing protein n=1 Tax=Cryptolaemus montrouzieri TaxID=559131 RepID=A0ABD2NEB1_9CUCU
MKFLTILLVITGVLGGELTKDYAQFNNHFSLDFFEKLVKGPSKNFVFSAFSQETILGLLSLGARGNSAAELKKVLHLPSSDDQIKSEFNNIYSELEQAQHVQISTANQIYLADGFKVEDEFLKTATDVFRAGVQNINFKNSEKAVAEMNEWVAGKTNNKIKNLITKDQISDITKWY